MICCKYGFTFEGLLFISMTFFYCMICVFRKSVIYYMALMADDFFHLIYYKLRIDVQAGVVSSEALLVAVDRAWPARHVSLHGIVLALVPSHESCIRMCGPPNAHHRGAHE